jgi:hypothetical protein
MMQLHLVLGALFASFYISSATILPITRRATASNSIPITGTLRGSQYDVDVEIGNQTYTLQLDTGSADVWVLAPDFICLNMTTQEAETQSSCNFGSSLWRRSPTFEPIFDEVFAVQYGSGNVVGAMGYDTVSLGGVSVQHQRIGIANMTFSTGDGLIAGIMGMGFPWDTGAHPANFNYTNTSFLEDKILYQPFILNALDQGLSSEPYFSLAINRVPVGQNVSGAGGFLGLGSLPDVPHDGNFVATPNEINNGVPLSLSGGKPVLTLWTLTVNSTVTSGETSTTAFQACPDTGNNFNAYPQKEAASINAQFSPPAMLIPSNQGQDTYSVNCNATAPRHGVTIRNQTFYLDPRDMIIRTDDGCLSAIAGQIPVEGSAIYFLGDAFFKNVVSVFDFGKNEMRFASRTNDSSASSPGSSPKATSIASPAARPLFTLSYLTLVLLASYVYIA